MSGLWDEDTFAAQANISKSYIQKLRVRGDGPPYLKVGRRVRYKPEAVREWLDARTTQSTSQRAA